MGILESWGLSVGAVAVELKKVDWIWIDFVLFISRGFCFVCQLTAPLIPGPIASRRLNVNPTAVPPRVPLGFIVSNSPLPVAGHIHHDHDHALLFPYNKIY